CRTALCARIARSSARLLRGQIHVDHDLGTHGTSIASVGAVAVVNHFVLDEEYKNGLILVVARVIRGGRLCRVSLVSNPRSLAAHGRRCAFADCAPSQRLATGSQSGIVDPRRGLRLAGSRGTGTNGPAFPRRRIAKAIVRPFQPLDRLRGSPAGLCAQPTSSG